MKKYGKKKIFLRTFFLVYIFISFLGKTSAQNIYLLTLKKQKKQNKIGCCCCRETLYFTHQICTLCKEKDLSGLFCIWNIHGVSINHPVIINCLYGLWCNLTNNQRGTYCMNKLFCEVTQSAVRCQWLNLCMTLIFRTSESLGEFLCRIFGM